MASIQAGRRWQGTKGLQHGVGPWASVDFRLSDHMFVGAGANADYRTHDERDELDGWHVSLSPVVRHSLDSRTLLEVGPQLEVVDAREDHRASRLVGIGVGVSHAFSSGLSASLSASFQRQRYRADDPLFAAGREETTAWLSARLLHRSVHRNRRTGPPRVACGAGLVDGGDPAFSGPHSQLSDDRHDDGREHEGDDSHAEDLDDEDALLVHRLAPYAPT